MRTPDVKSDVIFGFLAPENIEKKYNHNFP